MDKTAQKELESQALKGSATYNTSLNLSKIPTTDISVSSEVTEVFFSTFPNDSSSLEFFIEGSSDQYIDLSSIYLYMRLKLTDKDGKALLNTSTTAPGNAIFSSMFESMECYLNNVIVTPNTGNYAYTAYINKLLNNGSSNKENIMRSELFFKETSATTIDSNNEAYQSLKKAGKTPFECYSKLSHPLFFQQRYLPPSVSLRIKLRRSPNSFCLLAPAPAANSTFTDKLSILDTFLEVRKVVIDSKIESMHKQILQKGGNFFYPFYDYSVIAYNITTGILQHTSEILLTTVPTFALVGLVNSKHYNGQVDASPFSFNPNKIAGITLLVNGKPTNQGTLTINTDDNNFIRPYRNLCNVIAASSGEGCDLSVTDFLERGYFLIPLITTSVGKEDRFTRSRAENVKVQIHFYTATTESLTCIFYFVTPRMVTLDKSLRVTVD